MTVNSHAALVRSPDGAERNPGLPRRADAASDFAPLHPGYAWFVEIGRSRFIVADFTGQRNGVYYEAGFAAGLSVRVIWTCRKDDLANLHFDIRQYNCIDWEKAEDLRDHLRNRIIALMGEGPNMLPA